MSEQNKSNFSAVGSCKNRPVYMRPEPGQPQPWTDRVVWYLAFCSLAATVATSVVWAWAKVETRLSELSLQRLEAAGVDAKSLNLRWSYRDLEVHGEISPDISEETLIAILRQEEESGHSLLARGIRDIKVFARSAPETAALISLPEEPPSLSVAMLMQRDMATLSGVVESSAQRGALVDALLATGVESIHDNLDVVAFGETTAIIDTKVEVLANMLRTTRIKDVSSFSATLSRSSLDYKVSTLNQETANAIEAAASVAIMNFDISGETTVASNANVSVEIKSTAKALTLDGDVLSEEQRRRLTFAGVEASDGSRVFINNLKVIPAGSVPSGSDDQIEQLSELIVKLTHSAEGLIQMRGRDLTVEASVDNDALRASLLQALSRARASGIAVTEHIKMADDRSTADPLRALQRKLDAIEPQVTETVNFNSGTSNLTDAAKDTLNLVVEILSSAPEIKVEIEGHTDNVGRADVNEQLSRDRAAAVRQYLIDRSISGSRLVAVGYGSRRPVASNDTSNGRRKNRRVYFHVPNSQQTE